MTIRHSSGHLQCCQSGRQPSCGWNGSKIGGIENMMRTTKGVINIRPHSTLVLKDFSINNLSRLQNCKPQSYPYCMQVHYVMISSLFRKQPLELHSDDIHESYMTTVHIGQQLCAYDNLNQGHHSPHLQTTKKPCCGQFF